MAASAATWQVWVDTGGTFTDCVAVDPRGRFHRVKVLSSSALRGRVAAWLDPRRLRVALPHRTPAGFFKGCSLRLGGRADAFLVEEDAGDGVLQLTIPPGQVEAGTWCELCSPEEAPVLAARLVTGTPAGAPLPRLALRLATTRGTNALLERRGAPTLLCITDGFGDLLRIGTQQRPHLFALWIEKPPPLYAHVLEVDERLAADGSVLRSPDLEALARHAAPLVAQGVRSAAVALLHSDRNGYHEQLVEETLRAVGFTHVSRSAALASTVGFLERAETAVVDATLAPVVGVYLGRVAEALPGGSVHVMTSAGGLVRAAAFRPKDSLLSGPAGGVVGAALAGRAAGEPRLITFDMGGTSTDVARVEGDFEYVFEHRVGDALLKAPALAVESVAAGGGSLCWCDGVRLRVGPESAGASPGPACYGAGGPLTITDVNLLLGRVDAEGFEIPIDRNAAEAALGKVLARLDGARPRSGERETLLDGFLEIANERMAEAIRRISVRRGYDPTQYALVAFGGAGGQHACAVAALLGIPRVIVPADASLLSALGLGHAVVERFVERQVLRPLREVEELLPQWFAELGAQACAAVLAEGVAPGEVEVRRCLAFLRYRGQESALQVGWRPGVDLTAAFGHAYEAQYGYRPGQRQVEVESIRTVASSRQRPTRSPRTPTATRSSSPPHPQRREVYLAGGWRSVPLFRRETLGIGVRLEGPALIGERHSTTVVEAGWTAVVHPSGALVLHHRRGNGVRRTAPPPSVRLELFSNRFSAIAAEMGEMLRRTAISTNVKERLDFSCALLDAAGRLVVNAPHIPVHLGSLGECVRRVVEAVPLAAGDTVVTNHPAFGGSHLPDVTLVTAVDAPSGTRLGYVASRAHHAELGGVRPGSMPPAATALVEEGVVIPPTLLVRAGEAHWEVVQRLLEQAPYPSRAVAENLADLRAQLAANSYGARALVGLAQSHGEGEVIAAMAGLYELAGQRVGEALARLGETPREALEYLDDGTPLRVALRREGGQTVVDFTGSGGVHPGNLNATPAIVRSVVLYVLRLLVDEELPLNEGMLAPVRLVLPVGLLNPPFPEDPRRAPAVVGGNVETSQRLVDTLLKALQLAACSQGTMNNLLFGDATQSYYETVCGGSGACPMGPGADAVHTHMTNTRITDPEVLELRYPVRLERFAIRRGSGGAGRFRGGDGAVRELTFLAPLELSLLGQHRREGPYGLAGGRPGAPGRQVLRRADGRREELGGIAECVVEPGDTLILETPGGGGWGWPPEDP